MNEPANDKRNVVVTGLKIPFGSLVVFLIKLALASIPALLIVWIVLMVLMMVFMAIFGGMTGFHAPFQPGAPY